MRLTNCLVGSSGKSKTITSPRANGPLPTRTKKRSPSRSVGCIEPDGIRYERNRSGTATANASTTTPSAPSTWRRRTGTLAHLLRVELAIHPLERADQLLAPRLPFGVVDAPGRVLLFQRDQLAEQLFAAFLELAFLVPARAFGHARHHEAPQADGQRKRQRRPRAALV